ncbi:MAG: hypothetical protein MJ078_02005 [Clostridia bacterium]|nr:hypothetical protein [Clostridia bacterium]
MKQEIIALAKENWADLVGFDSASSFPQDDPIFKIFPGVKTVICLGYRVLRGIFRGIEEGSTFYQYTTMAVENMEETVMPMALLRVSNYIEEKGYVALPQRRHQNIMAEEDGMNPEVAYDSIYRGKPQDNQMDFAAGAVLCGIGERGFHGAVLTEEYGPMVRFAFILTDAVIEPDPVKKPHLCDGCKACVRGCPGHAIDEETGKTDTWKCAPSYNGAEGKRHPFMPFDAFPDREDRLAVIAGEAEITPEKARQIMDEIYFYPPAQHTYQCSICNRTCDVDCYCHLEEKGLLTKKFKTPFRKREKWEFPLSDFEIK